MLSKTAFNAYVKKMHQLNELAAQEMQKFIDTYGFDDMTAVVEYAYALATKYGDATSTLACTLYDILAESQGASVAAAVPAETASLSETWGAVQGSLNEGEGKVANAVSRLVKQAGADTMQLNASRDHAEMAFVPVGNTCPFCIMLGSRGWKPVSRNAKSHAAHIHANCDCQYIVRFNSNEGVAGYDEKKYLKIYTDADKNGSSKDKLKALRHMQYEEQKDDE